MATPLKNNYNKAYIEKLANSIHQNLPEFDRRQFANSIFNTQWKQMELMERLHHITHCLHQHINLSYTKSIKVLMNSCVAFGGYEAMFFPDYVAIHGLKNWQTSMKALEHFTRFSSSEFAVRPFIELDQNKMMQQMLVWSHHSNHHVRRLASEGCRPRLPWATSLNNLKKNPEPIIPILENLKQDSSLYVRKSVANNLNDISKDHPHKTLQWCKKHFGKQDHTDWIIKKGCRTLLKSGNSNALELFGYPNASKIKIKQLQLNKPAITIGDSLSFRFKIDKYPLGQPVRIEYGICFTRKNNRSNLKKFHLHDGLYNRDNFEKQHIIKQLSTRKIYPGRHRLEIFINGVSLDGLDFDVRG